MRWRCSGIPFAEAAKKVTEMNRQREEYVKHHFKREWRDFANYDLCVNTARLGLDGSAALVTRLARERFAVRGRREGERGSAADRRHAVLASSRVRSSGRRKNAHDP